jgi:membrane protease YdiL (CAAX protease family)
VKDVRLPLAILMALIVEAAILVGAKLIVAGTLLDVVLLFALLNYRQVWRMKDAPASACDALTLVLLLDLVALMLAEKNISDSVRYILGGAPLLVAALILRGGLRPVVSLRSLDLVQTGVAVAGAALSLPAYYLIKPPDLFGSMSPARVVFNAIVLFLFVAVMQELVFRRVVQDALLRVFRLSGVLWTSLLFVSVYFGVEPVAYMPFIGAIGLLWGIVAQETGSVVGTALSHGALLVGLLIVWPAVLG